MKILKRILIILLILIAIPLVAALFVNGDYAVEREVVINRPSDEVFNYVRYVKNQDHFSVWNQLDPDMEKTYTGTDGTVGFIYGWKSDNPSAGVGEQEIVSIEEGKRIDVELRFKEPFEAQDNAYLALEPVDAGSTKVKWGFTGSFSYPMNLMNLVMDMDAAVGKDLQGGLDNLKELLENQ